MHVAKYSFRTWNLFWEKTIIRKAHYIALVKAALAGSETDQDDEDVSKPMELNSMDEMPGAGLCAGLDLFVLANFFTADTFLYH